MQRLNFAIARACLAPVVVAIVRVDQVFLGIIPFHYEACKGAPLGIDLAIMRNGIPGKKWGELTSSVPGHFLEGDELAVDLCIGGAQLRSAMLGTELFEDSGKRIRSEDREIAAWRLTQRFVEKFRVANPTAFFDLI